MSVYMVFTREKTKDAQELATYNQQVPATLAGHPVKFLALYGAQENLEGAANEGTVIVEFPSVETAKAWYDGPEYRKVREHRFKGSGVGLSCDARCGRLTTVSGSSLLPADRNWLPSRAKPNLLLRCF